jgi:hypothetical protein
MDDAEKSPLLQNANIDNDSNDGTKVAMDQC